MEDREPPGAGVRRKRPCRKGHGGDDEWEAGSVKRAEGNGLIERTNEGRRK